MSAARRIARPAPMPVRDLFGPTAAAMEAALPPMLKAAPTPPAEPAVPQLPRALRLPRDFTVARELVWGCGGRRFVARDIELFNGRPAYHLYTAWELADVAFFGVVAEGLTPAAARAFGRIDTRRPHRVVADSFGWMLEQQAEARGLIRELCPEAARRAGESVPSSGVYDVPEGVRLVVNPAHRFEAARAAWRPV